MSKQISLMGINIPCEEFYAYKNLETDSGKIIHQNNRLVSVKKSYC